ncbi:MAG: HAMP domain-containing sensor histidine kinase, partial [Gammaproteobacteria bacterium]
MHVFKDRRIYASQEVQSALVRLGIWAFAAIYVSAGALSERYSVNISNSIWIFAIYLLFSLGVLLSVLLWPQRRERWYISLVVDISATSICIFMTGEAVSPFYLLYIWIVISYGTRYGVKLMMTAAGLSILSYSLVLTLLGQWYEYLFEASFILLVLVGLPIYQKTLMKQLYLSRSEAERSNRQMGRFLSNMTDDMRSPLADIMTISNELRNTGLSMKQLDRVDDICASATLLDAVIGDVLDFSKMEARQLKIDPAPFDVRTLLLDVCLATSRLALQNQIELVCSVSKGVPRIVVGDDQRLRQVLTNIIKNAITNFFCAELTVSLDIDDSESRILLFAIKGESMLLSDTISRSDDDYTCDDEVTTAIATTGLDLGIGLAKKQVLLMGGEIGSDLTEDGPLHWLRWPIIANDFDVEPVASYPRVQGKKVFVFEASRSSRETIINCCKDA